MSVESSLSPQPQQASGGGWTWTVRGIAAILLFLVGYIHLALLVNMFGLSHMLGKLFLLNAIGAFAALVLILASRKWYGWVLGILVAGGAAFAKLFMGRIPALRQFIMVGGGRFGGRPGAGSPGAQGAGKAAGAAGKTAGAHAGHFGPPLGHSILPLFGNMRTLGPQAVVIEIVFVVLALIALVAVVPRKS